MVKEDEEYARRPKKSEAEMSRREFIADLIWQLRDQESPRESSLDRGKILGQFPASRLLSIGLEAVPQLIEALDDERFAHSLDGNRHSLCVLRVGDCARLIIERLAHRRFADYSAPEDPEQRKQWAADSKERVLAWWAEFQKKGER